MSLLSKIKTALTQVWAILVALGILVIGFILFRNRSSFSGDKPSKKPPKDIKSPNVVKDYEKKKKDSDEKVDNMDRDDLISDVNARDKNR
jgi:hypothetical protein